MVAKRFGPGTSKIVWGNRTEQALQFADDPNPHRNPVGTDPEWDEMVDWLQHGTLGHAHTGLTDGATKVSTGDLATQADLDMRADVRLDNSVLPSRRLRFTNLNNPALGNIAILWRDSSGILHIGDSLNDIGTFTVLSEAGDWKTQHDMVPSNSNLYALGRSTLYWANAFIRQLRGFTGTFQTPVNEAETAWDATAGQKRWKVFDATVLKILAYTDDPLSQFTGEITDAQHGARATASAHAHGNLSGVTADQHHAQTHVIATTTGLGADHTTSGLTAGQYLRATAATTMAMQTIPSGDLGSGVADTTTFLRGDRAWVVPPSGAGASLTRISGASGAAGPDFTWQRLTANSVDVTTVALSAAVMTTTGLGSGLWRFKYTLFYQTAATTTGIAFGINHTGTVTKFRAIWTHVTTGTTATTGVGDDDQTVVAGTDVEGKSDTTLNAIIGSASAGVATINTDISAILQGIIVVTVSGSLELKIASEVAGSAVRITADSILELEKIA